MWMKQTERSSFRLLTIFIFALLLLGLGVVNAQSVENKKGVQENAILFKEAIEKLSIKVVQPSDKGVGFKYPYWLISQGMYPLIPDDFLSIGQGKAKEIIIQQVKDRLCFDYSQYFYFSHEGLLSGKAFYSDGEYYFEKYFYDSERRLVAIARARQSSAEIMGETQFQYLGTNDGPVCKVNDKSSSYTIKEKSDGNNCFYYYPAYNGKMENYRCVISANNSPVEIVSKIITGSGFSENHRQIIRDDHNIIGYRMFSMGKNGLIRPIQEKIYEYDDGSNLSTVKIISMKESSQNDIENIELCDPNGNWIIMNIVRANGGTEKVIRSISYY
jgi:hypothetical protein